MQDNPYTTLFGMEPGEPISRINEIVDVVSKFESPKGNSRVFVISGVRGSGKTVFLSQISKTLSAKSEWVVVDISPDSDMLASLASQLYDKCRIKRLFVKTGLNLSFNGVGFSIESGKPISSVDSVLDLMFAELIKQNKRVLITVDDVANNPSMRVFAHGFQRFLREGFPVYLLMSGVYNNINNLERSKTMTFLVRAPRVELGHLHLPAIASSYQSVLGLETAVAIEAAKLTKGYAFAYQVLGSILFDNGGRLDKSCIREFDTIMDQAAYSFIWDELGEGEKRLVLTMDDGINDVGALCTKLSLSLSALSPIRARLIKRGVLHSPGYGQLTFALPRFYEYVQTVAQWL